MLRFSNHASYPRLGHPTRSVHSAPHEHTQHAHANAFPTSINKSYFHVIHNINIISSQWRYQQQQQPHFIFTYSSIITIHVDMVFINNVISNQYHHNYHYHHISIKILNSNINNNSNKHNNIISTRTVFKQHISNNQNNIIHHNTYIYRIPLVKT